MIGMKHAVRQDPDVMLVGEMRDRETFETAIHAAETGHLVFREQIGFYDARYHLAKPGGAVRTRCSSTVPGMAFSSGADEVTVRAREGSCIHPCLLRWCRRCRRRASMWLIDMLSRCGQPRR